MGCVGGVLHVMGHCGWGVLVVFYIVTLDCEWGVLVVFLHVMGYCGWGVLVVFLHVMGYYGWGVLVVFYMWWVTVDGVCWWCFYM